ncbi:MAG: diaminopimelate decarboxylase [Candidatus Cryptobacteroides sp.]|nr:diaminopimelate decarboxylase [Bacteroidales bacterium]MDY6158306.1 diaminopimelate decarboxylase [Candidatus Cryptobacteroides sp.]
MLKGSFPIGRFAQQRTPFYYYDLDLLRRTLTKLREASSCLPAASVHYAVKANFNPVILKEIAAAGLGADCVSGGEIKAALAAGFPASGIVYAGVGKSDEEIRSALAAGISRFNVESAAELEVIEEIAAEMGICAPVSLRVNPDIGAHTHANITTGLAENKFGINYEQLEEVLRYALSLPHVKYSGLHFHIGSQILDMMDFVALCNRINSLRDKLLRAGLPLGDVNVGGGLGINYQHPNHLDMADFDAYFKTFRKHLKLPEGTRVHFELGRSIVAPCGSLIARVLYVKKGTTRQFAIVDASMTELIRPALYKAYHRVENISSEEPEEVYDVVGPVCESSDVFLKGASIDRCHRGDLIAIRSAGAYGESMASCYNCRPLPPSLFSGE